MTSNQPTVSVIVPARDAGMGLRRALESVQAQTYPNIIETIVAAADEADARLAEGLARVVRNQVGTTPVGLNLAIEASSGEIIVRCDSQTVLPPDYVTKAVETLTTTGAVNVGGMQVPVGVTPWERAIAAAMTSPIGAGGARYRQGGKPGSVETVYLGVFRREPLVEVGGFDEAFIRTQDYELNHRLIEAGGVVWFDPSLRVEYRPRGSVRGLWRQYFDYGRAKRMMAAKHPGSLKPRQMGPPLLVLGLAASLVVSFFYPLASLPVAGYVAALAAVSFAPRSGRGVRQLLALLTMHLSWGLGFLAGPSRLR